ncbi:hypothetical protein Tco_0622405 [Tanacetum coccineum]
MVACLEKTDANVEFHEIVDFLTTSSIHYALTFNFSKLVFDGMLRKLDNPKKKFLVYPRFLMVFLNNQLELSEPFNDVYVTPAHTLKVFSNMSRKGLKFSGRVTPLFHNMIAPPAVVGGEGSGHPSKPQPTPSPAHPIIDRQILITESSSPQNTQSPKQALHEHTELPQTSVPIPNVANEAVHQELGDRMVRAATTASLDAQQDSGNVSKTQSMVTLNEPHPQGEGLGSGPKRQDTIGGAQAQTWSEGGTYSAQ